MPAVRTDRERSEAVGPNGAATTSDHVPPKALFPKPRPSDLITVPSCKKCNADASDDDEYFRFALATRQDVFENPSVQALLPKVHRSLDKETKRGFLRSILARTAQANIRSPSGLYLGKGATLEVDLARLDRVVERITKGLFYHHMHSPLHEPYSVRSFSESGLVDLDETTLADLKDRVVPSLTSQTPVEIGDGVFKYWRHHTEDEKTSIWLLQFYEQVNFLVLTVDLDSNRSA